VTATPAPGDGPAVRQPPVDWRRRVILAASGVVAAVVAYVFATSFLPRWWAHRVGNRVDDSFTAGVLTGLLLGAVLTLAALWVARLAVRRNRSWRARGLLALAALAVAGPNLTTLGIVLGRGNAAHAGERTLDVQAPGFRGATLVGAVGGVAAFVGLQYLLASRRSRRHEIDRLRGQLRSRDAATPGTPPA
jgi:MFS family permease